MPAAREVHFRGPSAETSAGEVTAGMLRPLPHWPWRDQPQAKHCPAALSAALCRAPHAMADTGCSAPASRPLDPGPSTTTGAPASQAVPSPTCPSRLAPQA